MRLFPGDVVGRYRLSRCIGQGGMGTVWAAANTVTGRTVALKCIRPSGSYATARARFLREARAASLLNHPNVVDVIDAFESKGAWVIVMTELHGETLAAYLERKGALSVAETAALLLPVVSALGTAHERGLIHRDVKPENIFLLGDGSAGVKVLDFGLAKWKTPGAATETSLAIGTPAYMSPEQVLQDCHVDCRSDIWSLGLVLYQCLLGRRPLVGESIAQIVDLLRALGVPAIASTVPTVPADIAALLDAMLRVRRDERLAELGRAYEVLSGYTSERPPRFGPAHASVIAKDRQRLKSVPPAHSGKTAETRRNRPRSRWPFERAPEDETVTSSMPHVMPARPGSRSAWVRTGLAVAALAGLIGIALALSRSPARSSEEPPPHTVSARSPGASGVPSTERATPEIAPLASADAQRELDGEEDASPAPDRSAARTRRKRPAPLPVEQNPYLFEIARRRPKAEASARSRPLLATTKPEH